MKISADLHEFSLLCHGPVYKVWTFNEIYLGKPRVQNKSFYLDFFPYLKQEVIISIFLRGFLVWNVLLCVAVSTFWMQPGLHKPISLVFIR